MANCPSCSREVAPGKKFCPTCGAPIPAAVPAAAPPAAAPFTPSRAEGEEGRESICSFCRTANRPGARFCKSCGQPLAAVEPAPPPPALRSPQDEGGSPARPAAAPRPAAVRPAVPAVPRPVPFAAALEPETDWRRYAVIASVALLVLGLAAGGYYFWQQQQTPKTPEAALPQVKEILGLAGEVQIVQGSAALSPDGRFFAATLRHGSEPHLAFSVVNLSEARTIFRVDLPDEEPENENKRQARELSLRTTPQFSPNLSYVALSVGVVELTSGDFFPFAHPGGFGFHRSTWKSESELTFAFRRGTDEADCVVDFSTRKGSCQEFSEGRPHRRRDLPPAPMAPELWVEEFYKSRVAQRESAAVGSLRTIITSLVTFRATYGTYPIAMAQLGPEGDRLIDQELASGAKGGYSFLYQATDGGGGSGSGFNLWANPREGEKTRSFCANESGVIRFSQGSACNPAWSAALNGGGSDARPPSNYTPPAADYSQRVREWLSWAEASFQQGDYCNALASCNEVLSLDPNNKEALALRQKVQKTMNILGTQCN